MNVVIGLDAAWGGLGWCLATNIGPVSAGHIALDGRTWRMAALGDFLATTIAREVTDGRMLLAPGDPALRIVIEEPPMIYTPTGKDRRGSPAEVAYALGLMAGGIIAWSLTQPSLAYPWLVNPSEWRKWMGVGGRGRAERKAAAVESVRYRGWGRLTEAYAFDPKDGGAKADVAEAILIAVGAARNSGGAPKGPRQLSLRGTS